MQIHVDPVDTYVCHICRQDFKQVLSLTEHVYKHDKGGEHTCRHCQKDFTDKNKTRKHIGQIHAKEMFSCNDCPESSTGRDQLSNHMLKHDEAFGPGKANLGRASKKLDPQVEGSYKRKKTQGVIKPDKASDIKKKEVKHKAPDETTMPAKEEMVESDALTLEDGAVQTVEEKKPLKCNICGKIFTRILALEGHMQIHVKTEDTYDCHREVGQVLNLTEHVYMHDKGCEHTCPHCKNDFTDKNNKRKHIGQIHEKGRFYCADCAKSFTGKDQSSNLVAKQKEAKGFKCEAFGLEKADLERASKKLDPQVEGGQTMHKLQNKK